MFGVPLPSGLFYFNNSKSRRASCLRFLDGLSLACCLQRRHIVKVYSSQCFLHTTTVRAIPTHLWTLLSDTINHRFATIMAPNYHYPTILGQLTFEDTYPTKNALKSSHQEGAPHARMIEAFEPFCTFKHGGQAMEARG